MPGSVSTSLLAIVLPLSLSLAVARPESRVARDRPEAPGPEDCALCQDFEGGGGWGHSFQSPGALFDKAFAHPEWRPATCGTYHTTTPCGISDAMMQDLRDASRWGDMPRLRALVAARPTRIQLVKSRHAVQVSDCDGHIVAHLAIGAEGRRAE